MSRKVIRWALWLSGVAGPMVLFQQSCIDPDLLLRGFLQAFNSTLSFSLDNAIVAFR